MRRRTLVLIVFAGLGLAASPWLLIAGTMGWSAFAEFRARRPFDSMIWRAGVDAAAPSDRTVRLRMVDDLLARRLLERRTRAEVVALLGVPPSTSYFRQYDLVYYLGPERGFISIDSEWLGVRFGADGRVEEAVLLRD